MYKVVIAMEEVGEFPTFQEAYRTFYDKFNELGKKCNSLLVLETACWIEVESDIGGEPCPAPLMIDRIVKLGYSFGFLDPEGKLREKLPDVHQEDLKRAFAGLPMQLLANDLKSMLQERSKS